MIFKRFGVSFLLIHSSPCLHGNQKVRMQARKSWLPQLQFLTHSSLNWESLVPVLKTGGVLSPELLAHFWRGNSHILFPTHFWAPILSCQNTSRHFQLAGDGEDGNGDSFRGCDWYCKRQGLHFEARNAAHCSLTKAPTQVLSPWLCFVWLPERQNRQNRLRPDRPYSAGLLLRWDPPLISHSLFYQMVQLLDSHRTECIT